MIRIYSNDIPKESVHFFLTKAKKVLGLSAFHLIFLPCNYTSFHVEEIVGIANARKQHIQYMLKEEKTGFVYKNVIVYVKSKWNKETQLRLLKDLYLTKMWNSKRFLSDKDVNAVVNYVYKHYFNEKQNMKFSA
ncbi:hypothetical protein [Bacillus sp. NPDC094106]|uniref:hypothetical protein n=1 Tax=Bacillus sp. NPDC094106 TaxID=3363949 RepID=UPI0037F74AAF